MSNGTQSTESGSPSEMRTGRVKWFNNRAGYGFVTGNEDQTDYFVHHSAIKVGKEQYKYLVQGEYVSFSLVKSESDNYEFQVGEVSGFGGGQLMCETREEARAQRKERVGTEGETQGQTEEGTEESRSRQNFRPRQRGGGPREGEEWMLVRRVGGRGGGGRGRGRGGRGGRGRQQSQNTESQQPRNN